MKHFFRLLKSEDILCLALFKYLIRSKNGENNDFTYSSWKCLRITSKQNERGNIFILFPPYCFVALNLVVCWFFFTDKFLLNRIFFSKIQHFRIESYLFWWMRNYFEILWLKLNVNRMIKENSTTERETSVVSFSGCKKKMNVLRILQCEHGVCFCM